MPRLHSPCKDCENRHSSCHMTCEAYLEFKKKNDEQREGYTKSMIFEIYMSKKRRKQK